MVIEWHFIEHQTFHVGFSRFSGRQKSAPEILLHTSTNIHVYSLWPLVSITMPFRHNENPKFRMELVTYFAIQVRARDGIIIIL